MAKCNLNLQIQLLCCFCQFIVNTTINQKVNFASCNANFSLRQNVRENFRISFYNSAHFLVLPDWSVFFHWACTIKHYGIVIFGLHSKLVYMPIDVEQIHKELAMWKIMILALPNINSPQQSTTSSKMLFTKICQKILIKMCQKILIIVRTRLPYEESMKDILSKIIT